MMPRDIDDDFQGSWAAFLELPQVAKAKKKNKEVVEEAFRILLQQADVQAAPIYSIGRYITVKDVYQPLIKRVQLSYMLYHLLPTKHTFDIKLNADEHANLIDGFVVSGQCVLRPQRMTLDHLIGRMVQLKVFKDYPFRTKLPSSVRAVTDSDFVMVTGNKTFALYVARIKGDMLVLRYKALFDTQAPLYPNVQKQIAALWRRASIGDFR